MKQWLTYLRRGWRRIRNEDPLGPQEALSTRAALRATRELIWPHARRHKALLAVALMTLLTGIIVSLPLPLLHRFLVDDVFLGDRGQWLPLVLAVYAAAGVAMLGLGLARQYLFKRFQQKAMLDFQRSLFDRVFRLPKSVQDAHPTGYLQARLTADTQGVGWFLSSAPANWAGQFLQLAGNAVLLAYLEWRLALLALAALPLTAWLGDRLGRRLRILSRYGMELNARYHGALQDSLANATLIKTHAVEERSARGLTNQLRDLQEAGLEQMTVGAAGSTVLGLAPRLVQFSVLGLGGWMIIRGEWTLGALTAFQAALAKTFGPMHRIVNTQLSMQRALAAIERLRCLAGIPSERSAANAIPVKRLQGEIEFQDVCFGYDSGVPVLNKASFHINAGEHVGLIGASGVGKTTLLGLLMRFYLPQSGEIRFDGLSAERYVLGDLRRRIGYLSQVPLIVSGTIRDNLRYGNETAEMAAMERALNIAHLADDVRAMPAGIDTSIGERGCELSEGQKQRLALARVLTADPDILIFDEFSAPLDGHLESSIFSALPDAARQRTLIVISHRETTLTHVERVLLLENERIRPYAKTDLPSSASAPSFAG